LAIKRKDHENLTDTAIQKVINGFAATPPMKKKDAYEILNISANPTRLQKIIDEYLEQKERDKKFREANRGKAAQPHEIKRIIEEYLDRTPIADIAKGLYRNSAFVKAIIHKVGVPTRGVGEDYVNYSPLPDQCLADEFEIGSVAWSSKYAGPCIIEKEVSPSKDGEAKVYRIYVLQPYEEPEVNYVRNVGKPGFYAHQPAYELGKLDHLKQYGVDVTKKV
jgi:hypothetical protein